MRHPNAAVPAFMLVVGLVGHAAALEIKYNNWMPPLSMEGQILPKFAKDLEQATGGGVTMKVFSGGQLLGARATLAGIRDGVADIGFIVPTINASELPHVSMIPELLPFARDGFSGAAAADETIMVTCPECREDFARFNALWLGGFGPGPWKFMCKNPIKDLADIKGRRARVTGGMATRMITAIGGVGVNMNPPDINQAMQRGQIDCTFGPIDWMVTLRLKDVAKVVMDYDLGVFHGLGLFVTNRDSLRRMTPEQRATLKRKLPEWMVEMTAAYTSRDAKITEDLKREGIRFWKPTPDVVEALARYREAEPAAVAADMRQRGVKDPESLIRRHLGTLKKWEGIVDRTGSDRQALVNALREHVYSKVEF